MHPVLAPVEATLLGFPFIVCPDFGGYPEGGNTWGAACYGIEGCVLKTIAESGTVSLNFGDTALACDFFQDGRIADILVIDPVGFEESLGQSWSLLVG